MPRLTCRRRIAPVGLWFQTMGMLCDLEFAFELADLAASVSLERFRLGEFSVSTKSDGSPVTDVDRAVERALRDRIGHARGHDMVIGEEGGRSGRSERCWYLDPIDGTTRFVAGDPKWVTLIALTDRQTVMIGVVDAPALGERWWARRGDGAFRDGAPISVSTTARLSEAVVSDDWRHHIACGFTDHPLTVVAGHCARVRPHQGNSFLAVACGEADVAVGAGGHPWDYAALKIIVEEAGGAFTDFANGPRIDTRQAVATNALLHAQVLGVLPR